MTRDNDLLISEALHDLDRGGSGHLTEAERERADALLESIVRTPVGPAPARARWSRRRVWVGLGAIGATAVAAPLLMFGGGGAYATWSPTPTSLSGQAAAEAAETCMKNLEAQPSGAAVDVPTAAPGGKLVMAERRGEWTYVLIEGPGRQESVCLMRNDDMGKPGAEMAGHFTTDAPAAPRVPPDRIVVTSASEGQGEEGWFNSVEGFVGRDVTGVTVHTSSGLDIQASLVGGRFAAWWPGRAPSSENPGGETWSHTIHLADGSSRESDCRVNSIEAC